MIKIDTQKEINYEYTYINIAMNSPEQGENMNYVCSFHSPHWSCVCVHSFYTAVNNFQM